MDNDEVINISRGGLLIAIGLSTVQIGYAILNNASPLVSSNVPALVVSWIGVFATLFGIYFLMKTNI